VCRSAVPRDPRLWVRACPPSPTGVLVKAHALQRTAAAQPEQGGLQKDEEAGSSEPPESAALRSAEHSITERMRHAKEAGISWVPLWAPLTGLTHEPPPRAGSRFAIGSK